MVVYEDNALLLIRRHGAHGGGTWSTPGGYLEHGEDPLEGACREVAEEVGLQIRQATFIGATNDIFPDTNRHDVTLWFASRATRGSERIASPDEVAELGWFTPNELPAPLFEPLTNLLAGGGPGQTAPWPPVLVAAAEALVGT